MKFRLYYRGSLRANGTPQHKQCLRQHFHRQLEDLWNQVPLREHKALLNPSYKFNARKSVDGQTFTAIVNSQLHFVATLDITLLRPEEPGCIVTQGGDIDNRLKTLLDALTIPQSNQIPKGWSPEDSKQPFHCLLEDDNLITGLTVTVDRLLDSKNKSEVVLMIYVEVSATLATMDTLGLLV